jgi:hypothetical protein
MGAGLIDCDFTVVQSPDLVCININTDNMITDLSHTGARHEANVT